MEREIIAQKSKKSFWTVTCLVTGAVALVIGLGYLLLPFTGIIWLKLVLSIGGIVVGGCGLALGITTLVRQKRMPDALIEREGDILFVRGKEYRLEDVALAHVMAVNGDGGTIMIETEEDKVKCDFVADPGRVCEKINALVRESKNGKEENTNG